MPERQGETPEIDVTALMEEIRARIRRRQPELSPPDTASPRPNDSVATDVAALQSDYDIYHLHFTSHRRVLGRLVVLAKRLLRQLLTPILERQLAYNAANARVAAYLYQRLDELPQQRAALQALSERLDGVQQQQTAALRALRAELLEQLAEMVTGQLQALREQQARGFQELRDAVMSRLDALAKSQDHIRELERSVLRLKTELRWQEQRLDRVLEEARKRLPGPFTGEQLQSLAEEERHALDGLYVTFEDRFRGSREEIKGRLRVYLPIIREAKLDADDALVLDLGCGRGEWLELLREEGVRARGVDLNQVLVDACRQQGFEVVAGDALEHLRSLPDASVGAVTAFHLIEHLPFEVFVKLLDETVRVLRPGGVAIFETPNPENVLVGSYTFYLDPTHRHPLPSPLVQFMVEARGLCRVQVMPLHPVPEACRVAEAAGEVAQRFNEYFYGPQDYAVIGWKV
jgi:O-antigen chain-terminating methyltransferase